MIELRDPCGWHEMDEEGLHKVRQRLKGLESMTWRDILITGKKQNHHIQISNLDKAARDHLKQLKIDDIDYVSLRVSAKERVFGIRDNAIVKLLWWDPDQRFLPSK